MISREAQQSFPQHRFWIALTRPAQGKEHFFLIKQKGFSSKDFPLLIFPCKLAANWRQLLYTFVGSFAQAVPTSPCIQPSLECQNIWGAHR